MERRGMRLRGNGDATWLETMSLLTLWIAGLLALAWLVRVALS
jgi:hypothetical protein